MNPKWIPALLSAWIGPIVRLVVWLARDLRVRLDFALSCSACDHKVLFLDADNRVRRGAMFVTSQSEPYALLVSFIDRSALAERPLVASNFLCKADKHVRWTYGWGKREAQALLAAQALK